ncbi:hypothetical protein FDG2_4144 [Candidatus Protofrankia californiensis]|uniref:HTH hxlR-type domain-containing protein n=1 Tax=Candidatus Protofrankia californiensis TaxID=1839754 RepID=A0A1C3P3Z2_9ACTN|nr:hypothetical protein FDG2_4144 [Candidatus Protofrankia californiensis]
MSAAERRSLLHDLRRLLDPEWFPDVLVVLAAGPRPYTGLLQAIRSYGTAGTSRRSQPRIQDGVLSRTLRWLESRGLVEHTREERFPFTTAYRLTPPAEELVELLEPLAAWAQKYEDLLVLDRRERSNRRRS